MQLLLLGALHGKLLHHTGSGLREVHEQPGQEKELIRKRISKHAALTSALIFSLELLSDGLIVALVHCYFRRYPKFIFEVQYVLRAGHRHYSIDLSGF